MDTPASSRTAPAPRRRRGLRALMITACTGIVSLSLVVFGPVGNANASITDIVAKLPEVPFEWGPADDALTMLEMELEAGSVEVAGTAGAEELATACVVANVACPELAATGLVALTVGLAAYQTGRLVWHWADGHTPNADQTGGGNATNYGFTNGYPALNSTATKAVLRFYLPANRWSSDLYAPPLKAVIYLRDPVGNLVGKRIDWCTSAGYNCSYAARWADSDMGGLTDPNPTIRAGVDVPAGYSLAGAAVNVQDDPYTGEPGIIELQWGTVPRDDWLGTTGLAAPSPNPNRRVHSAVKCVANTDLGTYLTNPGGVASTTVDAYTPSFLETDGVPPAMTIPACTDGQTAVDFTGTEETQKSDASWTPKTSPLIHFQPNPKNWDPAYTPAECLPGGSAAPCHLSVQHRVTNTDGTTGWKTCHTGTISCTDYDTSTNQEIKDNPDLRCRYGPVTVDMERCLETYKPNPVRPNFPEPNDQPNPNPVDNPDGSGCAPSGWAILNPMSYVRATACLLRWAFVPDDAVLENTKDQAKNAWDNSPPGMIVGVIGHLLNPFGLWSDEPDGCDGPMFPVKVDVPPVINRTWEIHPFAACTAPATTLAGYARSFETALVWFGAIMTSANILLRAFGMAQPLFDHVRNSSSTDDHTTDDFGNKVDPRTGEIL